MVRDSNRTYRDDIFLLHPFLLLFFPLPFPLIPLPVLFLHFSLPVPTISLPYCGTVPMVYKYSIVSDAPGKLASLPSFGDIITSFS